MCYDRLVQFHDIDIYLTVLYVFVTCLFIGVRRTGSAWTTWYQKISLVQDSELRDWYFSKLDETTREDIIKSSDPAILKLARQGTSDILALKISCPGVSSRVVHSSFPLSHAV